jgi:hypothetical protein
MSRCKKGPSNWEKYGKASRMRKRARPWEYKCACDSPGAVAEGDDVICAGCLEKERFRYARTRYSYLSMPEEDSGECDSPETT